MEKIIKDFEDYVINDCGVNERSVWSTKTKRWMKPKITPTGYVQICFSKHGKHYNRYLHRLLLEAFVPNPENKKEIDHINTDKLDNRLCNLKWCSKTENMNNPLTVEKISNQRTGKPLSDSARKAISKTVYQYTLNGELVKIWESTKETEKDGFCPENVATVCRGGCYYKGKWVNVRQHKDYRWSYIPL